MVFFQHTLIKFHFPCSTDSPKANFPVVSSIPSIHLFGTLHRGQEVPWLPKMTQNESITTESCGWRQLEKQTEQVISTTYALFGSRNKGGCAKMKASTFQKDSSGFATQLTKSMKLSHRSSNQPCLQGIHSTQPWARQEGSGRTERQLRYFLIGSGPQPSTTSQSSLFWWFRNQPLFVTTSLSQWNKLKDTSAHALLSLGHH